MRYKLVLSDFDGTLLRRDDTISPRTVRAIADYTAAGGTFGISTGRAFSSIRKRLQDVGLHDCPILSCQGALFRRANGETLKTVPMPKEKAVAFLQTAEREGLPSQFYTADEIIAPYLDARNANYFALNRLKPRTAGEPISAVAAACREPILKVLTIIPVKRREELLAVFGKIDGVKVFASEASLIEAVSKDAGKGNGLTYACESLGLLSSECAAFGDEQNDVEMLAAAGLGVAVRNAVPEAKRAADYVTDDCDDDGVAKALEKITADLL